MKIKVLQSLRKNSEDKRIVLIKILLQITISYSAVPEADDLLEKNYDRKIRNRTGYDFSPEFRDFWDFMLTFYSEVSRR